MAQPEHLTQILADTKVLVGKPQATPKDFFEVKQQMSELENGDETNAEQTKEDPERESRDTFARAMQYEALRYQHRLFTLESKQMDKEGVDPVDLQASALALTYYEFLPRVTAQYLSVWSRYQRLSRDPLLPPLPAALEEREDALQKQLLEMNRLIRQRCAIQEAYFMRRRMKNFEDFPSVENKAKSDQLRGLLDTFLKQNDVSPDVQKKLLDPQYATAIQCFGDQLSVLQTRILALLSEGFDPKKEHGKTILDLYVDTLVHTYSVLAKRERDIAASSMPYETKKKVLEEVIRQRAGVASEMVHATGEMGSFQVDMSELTATQNMFNRPQTPMLTQYDDIPQTPSDIKKRKAILQEVVDDRTKGRLVEINEHLNSIEHDVLTMTPQKELEDMWNKHGRNAVTWTLDKIVNVVTFPALLPEFRESAKTRILEPLQTALGFPPGKNDFDQLTDAEKKVVLDRTKSIKDLIVKFDRRPMNSIRETSTLLQSMQKNYPASRFFGQTTKNVAEVKQRYPVIRTQDDLSNVIKMSNEATAYILLYHQQSEQFGKEDPPSGYMGELKTLMDGIQKNMSMHIDLGSAVLEVAHRLNPIPDLDHTLLTASIVGGAAARLVPGYISSKISKLGRLVGVGGDQALMSVGNKLGAAAGTGFYAYEVYQDWQEANATHTMKETAREEIKLSISDMHNELEELVKRKTFSKIDDRTYVHTDSGLQVHLPDANEMIRSLESEMERCYVKAGKDAFLAASYFMLFLKAQGVTTPWGLAILAIDITVRAGLDAWKKANVLTFMRDAPPWVLAKFGTSKLTNVSEYDILEHASARRLSGFFHSLDEKQKEEVRKKIFFTIFSQELGDMKEDFMEMTGERKTIADSDVLYQTDFQTIILPYAQFAIHRDTGVSMDMIAQGKIDSGWVVVPPDVTLVQIRQAMREAAAVYLQHVREKRYMNVQRTIENLEKEVSDLKGKAAKPDDLQAKQEELANQRFIFSILGKDRVFNRAIGEDVTSQVIEKNGGKTRMELAANTLLKGAERPDFRAIAGMPPDFFFTSGDVSALPDDPVTRIKSRQVYPRSVDEPEARVYPAWNDWRASVENLRPSAYVDGKMESTLYTVHSANHILDEIRERFPDEKQWAKVDENDGVQAARSAITRGAVRLMEAVGGANVQRDSALAEELYGSSKGTHPLVFTSLDNPEENALIRRTSVGTPPVPGEEHLRAVLFEGHMTKSGHPMVLATFFYGDVEGNERSGSNSFFALQAAAAHSSTSHSENNSIGNPLPLRERDLLLQSRMNGILTKVREGLAEQDARAQERRVEAGLNDRQHAHDWQVQKPERDRLEAENKRLRAQLFASAGENPTYIPGGIERDESHSVFRQKEGTFVARIHGIDVETALPIGLEKGVPTASNSPVETKGLKVPSDDEKLTFDWKKNGEEWHRRVRCDMRDICGTGKNETLNGIRGELRHILTTPLDLHGHPREHEQGFEESVRRYEIEKILDICIYQENPVYLRSEMAKSLMPAYLSSSDKQKFLKNLVDALVDGKGTIATSTYKGIVLRAKEK